MALAISVEGEESLATLGVLSSLAVTAEKLQVSLGILHPHNYAPPLSAPAGTDMIPVICPSATRFRQLAWAGAQRLESGSADFLITTTLAGSRSLAGNPRIRNRFAAWIPALSLSEELRRGAHGKEKLSVIAEASRFVLVDDEVSRLALLQAIPALRFRVFVPVLETDPRSAEANTLTPLRILGLLRAKQRILIFDDFIQAADSDELNSNDGGRRPLVPASCLCSDAVQIIRLTSIDPGQLTNDRCINVRPIVAERHLRDGQLMPRYAAWYLAEAARQLDCALVLPADMETAIYGRTNDILLSRMWPTLAVESWEDVVAIGVHSVADIVASCRKLLVPTEAVRSIIEARLPEAAGKTLVIDWTYRFSNPDQTSVEDFKRLMTREAPAKMPSASAKLKVLIAGHDFKFAGELVDELSQRHNLDVRVDKWESQTTHDVANSRSALAWADVIICEFASHNAVWYSWEKEEHQRLLIHFHGYELFGNWIRDIHTANVDAVVFVSEFYRKRAVAELGWEGVPTFTLPNMIDVADLDREKLDGAKYHLGMAGIVPILKRPDRALDLLERLIQLDSRYTLHIRGRNPWDYGWVWADSNTRDAYEAFYERLITHPELRRSVSFDSFGPDMGRWFQKIGWMLSPSTRETFHLAPVEGMASGAIPVVWDREGASEVFDRSWIHQGLDAAVEYIHSTATTAGAFEKVSDGARQFALRYDLRSVSARWATIIEDCGDKRFALYPDTRISTVRVEELFSDKKDATRLGWLVRSLHRDGNLKRLEDLVEEFPDIFRQLPGSIAAEVLMEQGLRRIMANRNVVPPRSAGSVYVPARGEFMTVVAAGEKVGRPHYFEVDAPRFLSPSAPDGIQDKHDFQNLSIDRFILEKSDAVVREARVRRPDVLAANGDCWIGYAALIAARRLGIPLVVNINDDSLSTHADAVAWLEEQADGVFEEDDPSSECLSAIASHRAKLVDSPACKMRNLRIGLIADQFTTETVSRSFEAVPLRREEGYLQVAVEAFDAIFVESAWEGPNDEWRRGVAYHPDRILDLKRIIDVARHKDIPVVFWNKEDPVHFNNFSGTAAMADHVFTTDGDKVADYLGLKEARIQTASSVPFFAQPSIHHPLPTDREFEHSVAYAGTYYGDRFKERSLELHNMLEIAAKHGLTIYDRQVGVPNSPYHFPPELVKFVREGVPYEEVLKVYKAHPVNINVNSARDSSTMYSRRVVEIAASGAVVLSGSGRGINEQIRGIPATDDPVQWEKDLNLWMSDEKARLTEAWNQMRCVVRSHLADQALAIILRTAGIPVDTEPLPGYALVVDALTDDVVDTCLKQSHWPAAVVVRLSEISLCGQQVAKLKANGIETFGAIRDLPETIAWQGSLDAVVHDTYFEDILHASKFGQWSSIGARYWSDALGLGQTLASAIDENEAVLLHNRLWVKDAEAKPITWLFP